MTLSYYSLLIFILLLAMVQVQAQDDEAALDFFQKPRKALTNKFSLLPVGSIYPKGWILAQMKQDLEQGFVGNLDKLAPDVLAEDDLYHTARRQSQKDIPKIKNMVLTGEAWETSIHWWNGESTGNWWDGYVRTAFLTGNEQAIQHSRRIVENLLNSQDEDGYIGIYSPAMRYQHQGSNGELWTQTTVFRMLLAYYEYTGEKRVLNAVEKAMALTTKHYQASATHPFKIQEEFGGVTHGLMMTDVCETLYRITQNHIYQDYAVFLYKNFSAYPINRAFNDVRYPYLMDKEAPFESHSVHTYEHLRSLILAYYATGYTELEAAYNLALKKLESCILPGGAGFGDEFLAKREADPDLTGAEYCGMFELRDFFVSAAQKSGAVQYADAAEKLTFNAMQGARSPDGKAITYCKTDNCTKLDGKEPKQHPNVRFKYSPTHTDAALCCNPNYGRNLPYYVSQQWMQTEDGLAAVLYGPSELNTRIEGSTVRIIQKTSYPLSDEIEFQLELDQPTEFVLYFRKPEWADKMDIQAGEAVFSYEDGFYKINRTWKAGDLIQLRFEHAIQSRHFGKDQVYFQRGPLVYVYPIAHEEQNTRAYDLEGFRDYYCLPKNQDHEGIQFSQKDLSSIEYRAPSNPTSENPWYQDHSTIQISFENPEKNMPTSLTLVPMGRSVLRQTSFPYNP